MAARPQLGRISAADPCGGGAPGPGVLSGVLLARAGVGTTGRWRPVR